MMTHARELPALFLMGPTASGKTELAMALAQHIPAEIISVDSAMVYRTMDVGTGKPTPDQLRASPHHLIDIRDPSESYSAAEFRQDALRLVAEIKQRGRIPLFVGGTLLYFRALQQGLSALPSANSEIRASLLSEAERIGWHAMHARLLKCDLQAAARIHPNDSQRIQRALEVYELAGKPLSAFFQEKQFGLSLETPIQSFALMPRDRAWLHKRIEARFHKMLENQLVLEVERLYCRGDLNLALPAMRAVGYRQIWGYLSKDYSYSAMVDRALAATRQLAKRQLSWLNSFSGVHLVEIENTDSDPLHSVIHLIAQGEFGYIIPG